MPQTKIDEMKVIGVFGSYLFFCFFWVSDNHTSLNKQHQSLKTSNECTSNRRYGSADFASMRSNCCCACCAHKLEKRQLDRIQQYRQERQEQRRQQQQAKQQRQMEMTRTSCQLHHDGEGVEGKQDHKVQCCAACFLFVWFFFFVCVSLNSKCVIFIGDGSTIVSPIKIICVVFTERNA